MCLSLVQSKTYHGRGFYALLMTIVYYFLTQTKQVRFTALRKGD
jgi:hypothetical protein